MNTKSGLAFFRKINNKDTTTGLPIGLYKLIDDVDVNVNYDTYYCANVVEKTFNCDAKLTFKKGGGFGANYRYCANCYTKWNSKHLVPLDLANKN